LRKNIKKNYKDGVNNMGCIIILTVAAINGLLFLTAVIKNKVNPNE